MDSLGKDHTDYINSITEDALKALLGKTIPERNMIVDSEVKIINENKTLDEAELKEHDAVDNFYRVIIGACDKLVCRPNDLNEMQLAVIGNKCKAGEGLTVGDIDTLRLMGTNVFKRTIFHDTAKSATYDDKQAVAKADKVKKAAWEKKLQGDLELILERKQAVAKEEAICLAEAFANYPVKGKPSYSLPTASYATPNNDVQVVMTSRVIDNKVKMARAKKPVKKQKATEIQLRLSK